MDIHEFRGRNYEYLRLGEIAPGNHTVLKERGAGELTLFWNLGEKASLTVDGVRTTLGRNQILSVTEFHRIGEMALQKGRLITFNRPFYCVIDHDSEVSCKGALFFGASKVPVLSIPEEGLEKFEILWDMFRIEMQSYDHLQIEMLQMMLKRLIILCTRLYREQNTLLPRDDHSYDLIREFNFLVEQHFRTKHKVRDYARLLHKSPKTLSNLFTSVARKSPLQFIHERKMLEARRLLHYTDKSIKEIAYEIGFEDIGTFGRFFKKMEKISPSEYRAGQEGKTAYLSGISA